MKENYFSKRYAINEDNENYTCCVWIGFDDFIFMRFSKVAQGSPERPDQIPLWEVEKVINPHPLLQKYH